MITQNAEYLKSHKIDLINVVLEAEKRIRKYIRFTPLEYSPYLSSLGDCNVFLKLESLQYSGSCKARGVMNKLLTLTQEEKERGVVTASTGNNGLATAYGLEKLGITGTVFLPENAADFKVAELRRYENVSLKLQENDFADTEVAAMQYAKINNSVFYSAYNDVAVIAGQGTIGLEIVKQLEEMNLALDSMIVPISSGGLVSGLGGYLKSLDKNVEIIGCSPANSAVIYESIKAGQFVHMQTLPTLAEAMAGGLQEDSITLDLCKEIVSDFILVSEDEIRDSMLLILEEHRLIVEGASALAVASFLKRKEKFKGKNIVLMLCGRNIGMNTIKELLN